MINLDADFVSLCVPRNLGELPFQSLGLPVLEIESRKIQWATDEFNDCRAYGASGFISLRHLAGQMRIHGSKVKWAGVPGLLYWERVLWS